MMHESTSANTKLLATTVGNEKIQLSLFRALVEQISDAIEIIDPLTGRFLDVNDRGCQQLGYTREELLELTVLDIAPPIDRQTFARNAQTMLAEGSLTFESSHRRKDGSCFPVEVSISHVRVERDFMVAVVRDITQRRQQEMLLSESDKRYRHLFQQCRDAMMTLHPPHWHFTSCNPAAMALFDVPTEADFCRLGPWDVSPPLQPDGSASSQKAPEMIALALQNGSHFFEWTHQQVAGDPFHATVLLSRVEHAGQTFLEATVRDITAQKQTEAELQRLNTDLESIVAERTAELKESETRLREAQRVGKMGSWQLDLTNDRLTWSEEVYRIFELDRVAFGATYNAFLNAVHPNDRELVTKAFAEAVRLKKPYEIVHRLCMPDGRVKHVQERGETTYDDAGKPVRALGTIHDITDRIQSERAIESSLRLLQSVVEHTPMRVFWKDRSSCYLGCNSLFARDAGYESPGEIIGKTDFELGWRDHAESYRADDRLVMDCTTTKLGYEEPQTTPDGRTVWLRTSKVPLFEANQKVIGVLGIYEDITERKATEAALKASETRHRSILRAALDGYWRVDLQGRLLEVNEAYCLMSGYTEKELLAMTVADVDTVETPDAVIAHIQNVIRSGGDRFETLHRRKDGKLLPLEINLQYRAEDGGYMVAFMRDITERKQSERELQATNSLLAATLESTADGILVVDRDGHVTGFNKRFLELWRIPESLAETRDDRRLLNFVTDQLKNPEEFAAKVDELYHTPEASSWDELSFRDGRNFERYSQPQRLNDQIVGRVWSFRDTTERKQFQAQMLRKQRLESIGTLAGGVAHDLNNTLAPILMVTDMMREDFPQETELIDLVEASARRGADMVKQLLTFARGIEGERLPIKSVHLMREIEKIIEGTFPKNIELHVASAKNASPVLGDATQLHQLLLNLCVNARDAMPDGGTLTLETHNEEVTADLIRLFPDATPGPHVVWQVRDTGVGIPAENLERIFDPFFTTKGPDKGSGLGLSTALGIAHSHGGFIRVSSLLNQGTTISVYLPAMKETGAKQEKEPTARKPFHGAGDWVLVVDDEESLRKTTSRLLKKMQLHPIVAANGNQGLALAIQHQAKLSAVITDLHMPQMNGLEFVRMLRRELPRIPVIITSGLLDDMMAEEFRKLGVVLRLNKPYSEADLTEVLKSVFQS